MEQSRRAVEAYKRTRLVDHVITDDDKVAPIYLLDEICDMLRTSSSDMVHEVVEYTMKRLDSKSPRVKQKALRMIKYAVVKGGPEFKRQMQRQAATVRQLFDYKGQPDVLRGDALNKAVRDTAHEAITAIFAPEDKLPQNEEVNKRIMGFGSTNYEMPIVTDLKKPTITNVVNEVLEFGSASIKQGLTMISGYSGGNMGNVRNDTGSYRGPSLRKSLTSERGTFEGYEQDDRSGSRSSSESVASVGFGSRVSQEEVGATRPGPDSSREGSSLEEKLLDTITAPGGMRLQPTRESLQKFLASVVKLNQNNLFHALHTKLHSPAWQVRYKALCIVEAIVRQRDQEFFGPIIKLFEEDTGAVRDCLQLPQTTLRDKALKVLDQLGVSSKATPESNGEGVADPKNVSKPSVVYDMPNLIDTGEPDLLGSDKSVLRADIAGFDSSSATPSVGDLLAGDVEGGVEAGSNDVFSGLSFHTPEDRVSDESASEGLFSGLAVNKSSSEGTLDLLMNGLHGNGGQVDKEAPASVNPPPSSSNSLLDLFGSVSLKESDGSTEIDATSSRSLSGSNIGHTTTLPSQMQLNFLNPQTIHSQHSLGNPQMNYLNPAVSLPVGMMGAYQAPLAIPQNFGAGLPGNAFFQQQFLSGMMGLQGLNMGMSAMNGGNLQGLTGPARDGFDFSGDASVRFSTATDSGRREDTKAFDFISDHVSAVRGGSKKSS